MAEAHLFHRLEHPRARFLQRKLLLGCLVQSAWSLWHGAPLACPALWVPPPLTPDRIQAPPLGPWPPGKLPGCASGFPHCAALVPALLDAAVPKLLALGDADEARLLRDVANMGRLRISSLLSLAGHDPLAAAQVGVNESTCGDRFCPQCRPQARAPPASSKGPHHSYALSFTSPLSSTARELLDVRGLGARIAAFVSRVDGEEAAVRVFA